MEVQNLRNISDLTFTDKQDSITWVQILMISADLQWCQCPECNGAVSHHDRDHQPSGHQGPASGSRGLVISCQSSTTLPAILPTTCQQFAAKNELESSSIEPNYSQLMSVCVCAWSSVQSEIIVWSSNNHGSDGTQLNFTNFWLWFFNKSTEFH